MMDPAMVGMPADGGEAPADQGGGGDLDTAFASAISSSDYEKGNI
jgi:hypothetical protein